MNTTVTKPSESPKKLDAKDMLEVLQRAVKRELNRKRALGQYAVIFEGGVVKRIQF
jgi:hypothetical protein